MPGLLEDLQPAMENAVTYLHEMIVSSAIGLQILAPGSITDKTNAPDTELLENIKICSNMNGEFTRNSIETPDCQKHIATMQSKVSLDAIKGLPIESETRNTLFASCHKNIAVLEMGETLGNDVTYANANALCHETLKNKMGETPHKDLFRATEELIECSEKAHQMDINSTPIACENIKTTFETARDALESNPPAEQENDNQFSMYEMAKDGIQFSFGIK